MSVSESALPLYYWNDVSNFGDQLSAAVVAWVTGRPVVRAAADRRGKLLAVGSVLDKGLDGDVVWGTGVHPHFYDAYYAKPGKLAFLKPRMRVPELRVLAVRGPFTRDVLLANGIDCPPLFGDPALILPWFFSPPRETRHRVGLVPHYKDLERYRDCGFPVIDVRQDWQTVVSEIAACERIVSTSLHGLIVAEAYGIPAVWLRESGSEGFVKFADYYLGTGRAVDPRYSLADALACEVEEPPPFDCTRLIAALREAPSLPVL
ncbi:polysaccharide pyruvyl transferase family protein [Chitinimonas koreensis]|uniref:polysaccharide pyruvyl transferase family protein n=1 Tax=Chitinimonas koreensis TaxID=356302 RepID=UPI0004116F51|nr:polysaccharide pyruvyl transferase family protein [Chitinimonas koreensis]QNM95045.1 polysaccharide pyruvyl transferase family protein [Chitinimonas koreensis]